MIRNAPKTNFHSEIRKEKKIRLPLIKVMVINTKNRQTFVERMQILKKYKNEYFLFSLEFY